MDKQEFKELWENCILPSFKKLKEQDDSIILRDGSQEVLCRSYNDIKNAAKRRFMKVYVRDVVLHRHKVAACLANAIVVDKPVSKKLDDNYSGNEDDFMIANEALAFGVALSILRAFIELKLERAGEQFGSKRSAYQQICEKDFVFPDTIMDVTYPVSVCWAWHHNAMSGHFDLLGTANLLFMIENYSVEVYSK